MEVDGWQGCHSHRAQLNGSGLPQVLWKKKKNSAKALQYEQHGQTNSWTHAQNQLAKLFAN